MPHPTAQAQDHKTEESAAQRLQHRLLWLLLLPFGLIVLVSGWLHHQAAGTAAAQQDQQLLRLAHMLGDSVVSTSQPSSHRRSVDVDADADADTDLVSHPRPVLLLAPPVEEFLQEREGYSSYGVLSAEGQLLLGDPWLPTVLPATKEAEFLSLTEGGITYRMVALRAHTAAGELIVQLADGSDARQHWLKILLHRVLLPNLMLVVIAGIGVHWAVGRALKPLVALKRAVERRSPRDLSPIDTEGIPREVQPLVQALNRLFALVNDQTEAQRRFVADAAHQLRTPLAGLQAQVEAWSQAARYAHDQTHFSLPTEQIFQLRDASRRTTQLANQLLALSRADATTAATTPMQCVDLQALCENVLALYLDAATHKHIDLGLEASAVQVWGHEWLLRELLINLVDNAIKYTPSHGHVTLRCAALPPSQGKAVLEVQDNGPGIALDECSRVTQRFYRIPGTTATGNGLGLAIASEIARTHQAELLLEPANPGLRIRVVFAHRPESLFPLDPTSSHPSL